MGRTRVTLADVAAASGVSVTTASLVLTGRARELRISEDGRAPGPFDGAGAGLPARHPGGGPASGTFADDRVRVGHRHLVGIRGRAGQGRGGRRVPAWVHALRRRRRAGIPRSSGRWSRRCGPAGGRHCLRRHVHEGGHGAGRPAPRAHRAAQRHGRDSFGHAVGGARRGAGWSFGGTRSRRGGARQRRPPDRGGTGSCTTSRRTASPPWSASRHARGVRGRGRRGGQRTPLSYVDAGVRLRRHQGAAAQPPAQGVGLLQRPPGVRGLPGARRRPGSRRAGRRLRDRVRRPPRRLVDAAAG